MPPYGFVIYRKRGTEQIMATRADEFLRHDLHANASPLYAENAKGEGVYLTAAGPDEKVWCGWWSTGSWREHNGIYPKWIEGEFPLGKLIPLFRAGVHQPYIDDWGNFGTFVIQTGYPRVYQGAALQVVRQLTAELAPAVSSS